MENVSNNFAESTAETTLLVNQQSDFNLENFSSTQPGDEDEGEDENEEAGESEGEDTGGSEGDNNPPLDPNIVHSPVTPQTGGKPKA